jgi:tRNA uridine 5-carboxymethylaminomethyl modification enzyme
MFTSRAEHRLLFNHGSAELRMIEHATNHKLLTNNRINNINAKLSSINHLLEKLESQRHAGKTWGDHIRRDMTMESLPTEFQKLSPEIRDEMHYRVRYQGYLEREQRQIEKLENVEKINIPAGLDFLSIKGLRKESALKLSEFKPYTLGQASRISGVNPADISVLMVHIAAKKDTRKE